MSLRDPSQAPLVPSSATGAATRSNSSCIGPGPSLLRALLSADAEGTCHEPDHDRMSCSEPASFRMTSW
jgi:hypothetical protein